VYQINPLDNISEIITLLNTVPHVDAKGEKRNNCMGERGSFSFSLEVTSSLAAAMFP